MISMGRQNVTLSVPWSDLVYVFEYWTVMQVMTGTRQATR
jgi:hypothetical protein